MTAPPLVSLIIRNRGHGGLRATLASAAAQTCDRIETIVVETTGRSAAAQPPTGWRAHPRVQWLTDAQRLGEAHAVNLALDAVHGDAFCLLDDDTVLDPAHVERLLAALRREPQALAVYGRCRVVAGGATRIVGGPLNRALYFHDEALCLAATLVRRSALALGCRFDETIEYGMELDFLEQVAARGEFAFLDAAAPTCTTTPRDGETGARHGRARRLYCDGLRFARWSGERVTHGLRAAFACEGGVRLLARGDLAAARVAFADVLVRYPGDPDALHGLARCELAADQAATAWPLIVAAIEFDPTHAAYRETAAAIRRRLHGAGAASVPTIGAVLPASAAAAGVAAAIVAPGVAPPRSGPCPCGSGKRYKKCCGRLDHEAAAQAAVADDVVSRVREAQQLLQRGAASDAAQLLGGIAPAQFENSQLALDAGRCCLRMHLLQPAFALFERALELDGALADAIAACEECCQRMFRTTAWQSAARAIHALLERQNEGPSAAATGADIHIVCRFDSVGGTERRALNLYRQLSGHAQVRLWTTAPPLAAHAGAAPLQLIDANRSPCGGTLVLVGVYFPCGEWLQTLPFERIVICHNLGEQFPSLIERLIQIAANPARPRVQLTFPSRLFRDLLGLDGAVEYSAVDVEAFRPRSPRPSRPRIVVGRHGRDYWMKFHPNDPAFFRELVARGHAVRILGGTPIAGAFADPAEPGPELLAVDAEPVRDFLERLDVFVYRKHPRFFETGGTSVLEAMAMELPVVVFGETCGVAEIIRDGENGFLVDSEAQALAAIDRLAVDRELRTRIGRAGRASVVALLEDQAPRLLEFYLGPGPQRAAARGWLRRLLYGFGKKRGNADVRGPEGQFRG